jgi:hypothetical protein
MTIWILARHLETSDGKVADDSSEVRVAGSCPSTASGGWVCTELVIGKPGSADDGEWMLWAVPLKEGLAPAAENSAFDGTKLKTVTASHSIEGNTTNNAASNSVTDRDNKIADDDRHVTYTTVVTDSITVERRWAP